MALKNPPIQDTLTDNGGFLRETWASFFRSITRESKQGFTGQFDIANGDTVTVVNGKITDVS